ncbi:MAG: histidine triad nucleotide-binding protein [Atopobiaceae bacterium]|jgi:histidine triad (HIT) family protein|nr:histidine triad nucleotide-binding protein [Atopobiaceae bacterium]MCH4119181.1 histidine triad nucleotide-binding protein [Atopobiaceae bacterium]MCI1318275.1 histidine triad nucleotide-binding protein [Atopobiaceae bacterium]MCI1388559.1 histidine triad nucleotide-binding protein [Atopobiaceae bacterium]MCI1432058.1 histidine triad nucleotide-binding protein [Atopobiaceae bacterium]
MAEDCIFCKIVNGELGTELVYEDDLVAAFKDMNPQAPVHVLVVPKRHYENIIDDVPAEVLKAMADAVKVIAEKEGIAESGFRVIMNTGDAAGQTVHHLHMHVLGGRDLGEGLV